ncbi:MAG: flippase [Bacteroidetes bacterium]|nr:flippase [Bacteroidota bacterium]
MHFYRANIWKNSFFAFLSQAIRLLTNLFVFVGIARLYGPEIFGQFSIAYTVATMCIVIADFGFDVLLTTEIARNRSEAARTGKRYFSLKIIFASISSLIMIAIPTFQTFSEESRLLIYVLTVFVILTTFNNFFYAIFRGFEKFEFETKISFTSNFVLIVLLAVFGFMKVHLVYLMLIFIFARLLSVTLCGIKTTHLIGENICKIDFSGWKTTLNHVLIFGFHFIFGNFFFQLDTILLGIWKGDHDVGIYKSAFNVMTLVLLVPDIVIATMLPVLSRLHHESIPKWQLVSKLLYKMLFLIALPISLLAFLAPEEIIRIIYGKKFFDEAIPILKIFSLVIFIRFIDEPFALMITTARKQHIRMLIVIIATVISFGFNYWTIPIWGAMGAAMVSLGVNVLVAFGYIFINKSLFVDWTFEFKLLAALIVVILTGWLFSYYQIPLIVLCCFVFMYLPFAFMFGLSMEDRKLLLFSFALKSL